MKSAICSESTVGRLKSMIKRAGLAALLLALVVDNAHASAIGKHLVSGLVSYYTFDHNDGSLTIDSVSGNDGILSSEATFAPGRIGSGVSFSGNGGYVTLYQLPTSGTGDFSIFGWVKVSDSTGDRQMIISYGQSTAILNGYLYPNQGLYLYLNADNSLQFDLNDVKGPTSIAKLNDGVWYYIGVVNNGGYMQLFVNGVPDCSPFYMSPNITPGYQTIGATFGNGVYNSFFDGTIDEVGIWSRPLSSEEISALYNDGVGLTYFREGNSGRGKLVKPKHGH